MVVIPPLRRITWRAAIRIIASRYPPIDIYERVSPDPAVWEALIAVEELTNPRLRDEAGEIRLVPVADRISGPGATYVMAPFTHLNPKGSRFAAIGQGAYYAADDLATAIAETAYHFGRFAADSGDGPRYEDMRVLAGRIDAELHDIAQLDAGERQRVLDPDSYAASQTLALALREAGSEGVHYASVRRAGGFCVSIFRPSAVGIPVQTKHLKYHWDGVTVRRYFDYEAKAWVMLETIRR
ncbi:MAG: RES family NAD+ phosphorylase [Acetobacteraceae bacterium]